MKYSLLVSILVLMVASLAGAEIAEESQVGGSQPALARSNKILKNRRNAEDLTNEEGGSLRNGGKGERKGKRGNKRGKKGGMKRQGGGAVADKGDAEEGEDVQRRLQSEDEARIEVDRLRQEMRARKEEEMRQRFRNSRSRGRDEIDSMDPDHFVDGRHRLPGESIEDYMAAHHQEMRDRHRRDRGARRDHHSGRRDRKRPEHEGRHAVLRRRIDKHANLFTPAELAEIDDELKEHKIREDKLDAARDKLNAKFDALRDIDDRDERLDKLEELKELRANGRDAERAERDKLREEFQLIRERLEAKLRSELR